MELGVAAADIVELTAHAEAAIAAEDHTVATESLEQIATRVFALSTFRPEIDLGDRQGVLRSWVNGRPLAELVTSNPDTQVDVAQFIESDLIYRLVWGMEAARVYEAAQSNPIAAGLNGSAATAIETGTLSRSASVLIRAGFDHRVAAINAVEQTAATFNTVLAMREWMAELDPELISRPDWPTVETHGAWLQFANRTAQPRHRTWRRQTTQVEDVTWSGRAPRAGRLLRVTDGRDGTIDIWSPGYDHLGAATLHLNPARVGTLRARRLRGSAGIQLEYRGPDDLFLA